MTNDYNNGEWWGWNGGECPVHSEDVIDLRWNAGKPDNGVSGDDYGPDAWSHESDNHIVAFRVINAYREPRVRWSAMSSLKETEEEAQKFLAELSDANPGLDFGQVAKWVEVLP
jgi:hypothetical protein